MNSNVPISEDDLHAYVDGVLGEDRRREVDAYLAGHGDAAESVRAFSRQNSALHDLFDATLDEPIPLGMASYRGSPWQGTLVRAAAAIILVLLGGAGGWWSHDIVERSATARVAIATQAATAHSVFSPEVRHPVEVDASEEAHLVKWLSKRVGAKLLAPSLINIGYNLVGGRLVTSADAPAAYFMYENKPGNRITLYVRARGDGESTTAFRYMIRENIGVFYWMSDSLGYAVAGELTRDQLLKIAKIVYQQLGY